LGSARVLSGPPARTITTRESRSGSGRPSALHGVGAPRNTPIEIIDKLNQAFNLALAEPAIKARLADMSATVLAGSPGDFGRLMVDKTEKWAKVVNFSGAKAD
jgi:tripartite-type tricarboxylate transporter receptor subunit TctC